jgi:hypothetical protein
LTQSSCPDRRLRDLVPSFAAIGTVTARQGNSSTLHSRWPKSWTPSWSCCTPGGLEGVYDDIIAGRVEVERWQHEDADLI